MKLVYPDKNGISLSDVHTIKLPKYTELFCNVSAYPELEKIVLVGCKKEPKIVKTDEGWEVLL